MALCNEHIFIMAWANFYSSFYTVSIENVVYCMCINNLITTVHFHLISFLNDNYSLYDSPIFLDDYSLLIFRKFPN